jgi:hypothetical protein
LPAVKYYRNRGEFSYFRWVVTGKDKVFLFCAYYFYLPYERIMDDAHFTVI